MVFHGSKWGWRATAVRLLIAPVLAAGVVAPAATPAARAGSPPSQAAKAGGDPKALLKAGREALKAGQFDQARALARQADAANPSGRWGLFDDTPETLEGDVRKAQAKADKAEAEKLAKAAKELAAKPAHTPGEKIANLDQAYAMADRAVVLAGPADFFDGLFGGDRPEALKKEIDAARTQLRKTTPAAQLAKAPAGKPTAPVLQVGAAGQPADPAKVTTAGMAAPVIPAPPAGPGAPVVPVLPAATAAQTRTQAIVAVADGRKLLKENRLVEAKGKATQAAALNVSFAPTEDTPDALLRDVAAAARGQVEALTKEAESRAAKKDYAGAESALGLARQTAAGMGFPTRALDDQLATVRTAAAAGTSVAAITPVIPAAPAAPTVPTIPVMPPGSAVASVTPALPGVGSIPVAGAPAVPVPDLKPADGGGLPGLVMPVVPVTPAQGLAAATPPAVTGQKLLAQAQAALRRGELEEARMLATQAHKDEYGVKAEAQDLLRLVDAERAVVLKGEASQALKNAAELRAANHADQALGVLRLLDPADLSPADKTRHADLTAACLADLTKLKGAVTTVAANDPPKPGAAGLAEQQKALAQVEVQRLRTEALETESKAKALYDRGETDLAIQMLADLAARIKASTLTPSMQGTLLGPVERRLAAFQIMKRQTDFYTKEARDKKDARELVAGKALADAQSHDEIKKKTREVADLVKVHKYKEAEALALQLKAMDPEDPALNAMYLMAKNQRRVEDYKKLKDEKEEFTLKALNDAERSGPLVDMDNPLKVNAERSLNAMKRGDGSELYFKTRTPAEREIELRLDKPLSIEFSQTPVRDAVAKLREQAGLNISFDDAAIEKELPGLSTVVINESLKDLSLRNVLTLVLEKARLKFVVRNDVIQVTTETKAKGALQVKVFSVMDLVTPVPDFALPDHATFEKAVARVTNPNPGWMQSQQGGNSVYNPSNGLANGQLVSGGQPWAGPAPAGSAGTLDNKMSPLASSATLAAVPRQNASQQLKKLITGMVRPYSWDVNDGPGKLEYYDIGGALVVNQTADVIREVQDLLESLRRLQETSVAVEVRVISLSEAFFERVGVDFSMNVSTQSNSRNQFERSLTTGAFRPEPYLNSFGNTNNVTVGYNPAAGGFTPDLNVPIRATSYPLSLPPFGGYQNTLAPGSDGGLSVGLAFLNDIQVYMFMEAAQGDRRVNIMQAPKVTLFNGQTSTVFVSDVAFFTLGLQVINVGGQFVYIPQSVPLPIGNSPPLPGSGQQPGVALTVQAIVSSDRRYVRMNLSPSLTALTSATVPLFPVTAFITPVFEGGSQGVPIPFTQFFQQPSVTSISVQTTVAVPDGGTVVLGGLKTLSEGRNEFGPPVLSDIPYLNRLFRNQGIGRETRHVMIMVTPRIIIQSEEEVTQTGQAGIVTPGIGGQ